ncbi:uncharacterized protein LOC122254085 [Penaeus japonicus]|uniref:uncharacterized protein LOC122254085 n=1 Tax=Penaeus japonicus TaxID=27405 RepID=UPI001C70EB96|nr:uncharacterized protein LOC122254085 [Penaeus japonicus]
MYIALCTSENTQKSAERKTGNTPGKQKPGKFRGVSSTRKHEAEFSEMYVAVKSFVVMRDAVNNTVFGSDNTVYGSDNTVYGSDNMVYGSDNTVFGSDNMVFGSDNTVYG